MSATSLPVVLASVGRWSVRRWLSAASVAAGFTLFVAIPTDLVDTRLFGREVPPTWWSWPALVLSAVLVGLLAATYVDTAEDRVPRARRGGWAGGVLTFFAVGCPVCNKLVLLVLGTSGALTWFEPVQPLLQVLAVALLAWALVLRLRGEVACPVPDPAPHEQGAARA